MIELARFGGLALFVAAAWQMIDTFSARPAFNHALHVEVVTGGTRPLMQSSMYSRAEYLYQIAYGYQNVIAYPLLDQGVETLPSDEELYANAEKARASVEESLRVSPGNPMAWLSLASGESTLGAPVDAVAAALRNSYITAPNYSSIAGRRLFAAVVLAYSIEVQGEDFPMPLAEIIKADVGTLQKAKPKELKKLFDLPFSKAVVDHALRLGTKQS